MKQKIKAWVGYAISGGSIALYMYLVSVLDVPDSLRPLRYLGWLLLGLGVGLIVLSIVTLVRNRGGGLIEDGIYGIVRHPMYLGAMFCFSAYCFFVPHWLVLLIVLVNVGIAYGFMLQGDRENVARFGAAYRHYMDTVPRMNLLAGILRHVQNT
jgi:protein-S-isoprenylcysteine O-methyltransferase Ste14